jgi:hypothetical protein
MPVSCMIVVSARCTGCRRPRWRRAARSYRCSISRFRQPEAATSRFDVRELKDTRPHSRDTTCPSCSKQNRPRTSKRAQGMPGDGLTHGPPATKAGGSHHRSSPPPAFPARWFTAYIAISPGTGLSCPRRLRDNLANLASASGGQDHATSPSASATFVSRAIRVHRIPAPHIVTIGRNVPLHRGGMRESMVLICPTPQAADWHDEQFAHGVYATTGCLIAPRPRAHRIAQFRRQS